MPLEYTEYTVWSTPYSSRSSGFSSLVEVWNVDSNVQATPRNHDTGSPSWSLTVPKASPQSNVLLSLGSDREKVRSRPPASGALMTRQTRFAAVVLHGALAWCGFRTRACLGDWNPDASVAFQTKHPIFEYGNRPEECDTEYRESSRRWGNAFAERKASFGVPNLRAWT